MLKFYLSNEDTIVKLLVVKLFNFRILNHISLQCNVQYFI